LQRRAAMGGRWYGGSGVGSSPRSSGRACPSPCGRGISACSRRKGQKRRRPRVRRKPETAGGGRKGTQLIQVIHVQVLKGPAKQTAADLFRPAVPFRRGSRRRAPWRASLRCTSGCPRDRSVLPFESDSLSHAHSVACSRADHRRRRRATSPAVARSAKAPGAGIATPPKVVVNDAVALFDSTK
jgi:hypothetical protein